MDAFVVADKRSPRSGGGVPKKAACLVVLGFGLAGALALAAAAEASLHYRFRLGEEAIWTLDIDNSMSVWIAGDRKAEDTWRVSRRESALVRKVHRDKSATLEARIQDETVEGDGEAAERARSRASMRARLWMEFHVTPSGKLLASEAHDVPDGYGPTDGLREELRPMVLPEGGGVVGASWADEATIDAGGFDLVVTTTYTFAGVRDVDGRPHADIDATAAVRCEFPELPPEGMTPTCTGEGTGTILFDIAAGRPVRSEEDVSVTVGLEARGVAMEMRFAGTARRELERVDAAIPKGFF